MMYWIVNWSVKFRRIVMAIAAGLLIFGLLQLDDVKQDILPEFSPTTVEVRTEALGLSTAEVEQLITVPLEQDLLNGVAFLETIESASLPGLSSVVMTFEQGNKLFLESPFSMMFGLSGNVISHVAKIGITHGKCAVARLP